MGAETQMLGDNADGSRVTQAHLIDIYDADGTQITPDSDPMMPFSMEQTCGQCHSYDAITSGWHFNAMDPNVPAGRPAQPWLLVDPDTGTQLPLAYRNWPGAYNPKDIGISHWQFLNHFGTHMPGDKADPIADEDKPEEVIREMVSGKIGVNCMACHSASPAYDGAEYAHNIEEENFRWAN